MEIKLNNLNELVSHCQKCDLSQTRTQVVFGDGNINGGIMAIGEAPGKEEDLTGKPFVGRSGKLLDEMLNKAGFTRNEHVYIANIVKCRPPENRVPSPFERNTCLPYLLNQIEIINPKIIILLGSTALHGLIDKKLKITQVKGKWMDWNNRLAIPIFHPSAILRNQNLKPAYWDDFKIIIDKYRELINTKHSCENY